MREQALENDFLKKFLSDPFWQELKTEFDCLLGNPAWLNIEKLNKDTKDLLERMPGLDKDCVNKILELVKRSRNSGQIQESICRGNEKSLCIPISIENKNYGYLCVINFKKDVSVSLIKLLGKCVRMLSIKSQKDLELQRLYDTIEPRTLALSTIHTLHRLMSSSLNLNELLPRIARLSLQVLGATICVIYLYDKRKKALSPKVSINLKNIDYKKMEKQVWKETAGEVAESLTAVLKKDLIVIPFIEKEDILGVILVAQKSNKKAFTYFDQDILTTLAEQAVIVIKNARLSEQQERLTMGSIRSISSLLKIREDEWHSHTPAFRSILSQLAQKLSLSKEENLALQNAALLYSIEKINIPEQILKKNKPLTNKEVKIIKEVPFKTINILKPLQSLEPTMPIILYHHERYDGKGYPSGLKGKQIPIGARIMAVVDAFEAMITKRPWRRTLTINQALLEIKKNSGTQFDPLVVEVFLKVVKEAKIRKKLGDRKKNTN